ncbi:MAG TPA: filamentous hemagglutinin, partial [Gammaproteobacteria bacterium]|nr:filamentous hemagglutinin [Gammaproteobacteria bacterium]
MSKHRTNLDRPQRRPWAERTRSFVFAPLPLSIAWLANPLARAGLVAAGVPGLALAGPQGGSVVAGAATISNPDGSTTLINQTSQRAALDWHSFSIGSNEYVQFIQPGTSSVALNRVVGGDPSSILGSLSANGQVFLVNPSGVYFGSGATVDVAGLLATTLNIDNDDFMAGNYVFQRNLVAPDGASVVNDGVIAAREGGYVVLAGDYVENSGIVEARLGTVALAAGSAMTLDVAGDGLINFTVDGASVSQLAGVNNAGELYADGGRVIMTAKVAANLVHAAVNNSGRVQAQGVLEQDGAIYLVADGGDITLSGELDVSGPSGDGGYVRVRSTDDVTLTSGSRIDAT